MPDHANPIFSVFFFFFFFATHNYMHGTCCAGGIIIYCRSFHGARAEYLNLLSSEFLQFSILGQFNTNGFRCGTCTTYALLTYGPGAFGGGACVVLLTRGRIDAARAWPPPMVAWRATHGNGPAGVLPRPELRLRTTAN